MPISRTYACPECGGQFKFLHMTRSEPPPSSCELCGASFDDEPQAELPLPAVGGSAIAKSVEQVFAQAEATRYDADGNKVGAGVTNWNDGLRPGEVAARPVENMITAYQREMGAQSWGGANAREYAAMAKQGPGAVAGNPALAAIQSKRIG